MNNLGWTTWSYVYTHSQYFTQGLACVRFLEKKMHGKKILFLPVFLRGVDWGLAPTNRVTWIEQSEITISVV